MSFVNYTDVAVKIDGASVYASSANINSTLSFSPVRSVGVKGAIGMVPDGPAGGEASIDLVGGAGYSPPTDLSDATKCKSVITVGGSSLNGYPTSFSISMAPNEIVTASLSLQSFESPTMGTGGGGGGSAGGGGGTIFGGGHGAAKGSSGAQMRAEYNFSAGWDAIYFIGSMCPQHIYNTEGSAEATVEGPDITGSVGFACTDPCPGGGETVSFSIGGLCGGSGGTYSVTGYSTGGGTTVSEGGVLSGTKTVVQFFA